MDINVISCDVQVSFPEEKVEQMAKALIKAGAIATPIQLKSNGLKDGYPAYKVVTGFEFHLAAAKKAYEINPKNGLVTAWIDVDFTEQNEILASIGKGTVEVEVKPKPEPKPEIEVKSPVATKKSKIKEEIEKYRANPSSYSKKEQKAMEQLIAMVGRK